MVLRVMAWMTRLRMMRACCSHSKNENSGTQLCGWDMVGLRRGRARDIRPRGRHWGQDQSRYRRGIYAVAGSTWAGYLAATEMRGLKELWGFSGDFQITALLAADSRDQGRRAVAEHVEV